MVEIAWFWLAAAAASSFVGAGLSIKAGKQQAQSMADQAAAAEMEARVAGIDIKQTQARRTEALVADLGAIRARRATMNVGATSASAISAEKGYEKEYLQSLRSDILAKRYGVVSRLTSARGLRIGAKGAMISGYASAAGNLAQGFSQIASTGPSGGGG
jgi:hypothetical protein